MISVNEINFLNLDDDSSDHLSIVYCILVGMDGEGKYVYHFYLSDDPESVFSEYWGDKPACNCDNEDLMIACNMYSQIYELKTDIIFDLIQDNCCFSCQDAKDHCVSMAYENIDTLDEYPPDGRIIINFGDNFGSFRKDIEERRGLLLKKIDNDFN